MTSQLPLRLQHLLLGADPSTGKIVNLATVHPRQKQDDGEVDQRSSGRPLYVSPQSDRSQPSVTQEALSTMPPSPPRSRNGLGLFVDDLSHDFTRVSPLFTYKPLIGPVHPRRKACSPPKGSTTETDTKHAITERQLHPYHRAPLSPPVSANGLRPQLGPKDVAPSASIKLGHHGSLYPSAARQLTLSPIMGTTNARPNVPPPGPRPRRPIDLPRATPFGRDSFGKRIFDDDAGSPRAERTPYWSPHDLPTHDSVSSRPPLGRCHTSIADLVDGDSHRQDNELRPASWPAYLPQQHHVRPATESPSPSWQTDATREEQRSSGPRPNKPKLNGEGKDTGANARRATNACDRCRMHKIRCKIDLSLGIDDGTCGRCVQSGAVCSYFRPRKKRGPTSKVRI